MHILVAQTQPAVTAVDFLPLVVFPFVFFGLRRARVFRAATVAGPDRMVPGESLFNLLLVLGTSYLVGIAAAVALKGWLILPEQRMLLVIGGAFWVMVAIAILLFTVFIRGTEGMERLGVEPEGIPGGLWRAAVTVVMVIPLVYLAGTLVSLFLTLLKFPLPKPHPILEELGQDRDPVMIGLMLAMATVLAPIAEELTFRGYLQTLIGHVLARVFQRRKVSEPDPAVSEAGAGGASGGAVLPYAAPAAPPLTAPSPAVRWAAIAATALLFAIIHGEPAFVPPLFVLALGLGYAYERTGNLWVPIFTHAMFNGVQIGAYFLLAQNG